MKGIGRIIVSYSLVLFSLILGISLLDFSPNDLSFYTTALSPSYSNILGSFGTYTSVPFVLFYGQASWIWTIFSLMMGLRLLTGIDPKVLATRFALTHFMALVWATLSSLTSGSFSFVSGGIFGAMTATILTNILPNFVWIPMLILGFLVGLVNVWSLPKYLYNKYLDSQVLVDDVMIDDMDEIEEIDEIEDMIYDESDDYDMSQDPYIEREHLEDIDYKKDIEEFSVGLQKPFKYDVPSFLREEQDDVAEEFLSKKPLPFPVIKDEDFLTRDVEIDLLAPYMNSDNPLYEKLEQNQNTTLAEDFKDIIESLDDLDYSSEPVVPNSQWVRESGVSVVDFVRKPTQRLSFRDTQETPLFEEIEETIQNIKEELQTPIVETTDEILVENTTDTTVTAKEEKEETIEVVAEAEEVIPQHISNFPPVSNLDSDTPIILPEFSDVEISMAEIESQMTSTIDKDATTMSESEKLLIQGVERTIKKQQEESSQFKDKIQKKQQELAKQFYQTHVVEEISFPQVLTTSFAIQDFEREIIELKEKSKYSDAVSQALSDKIFIEEYPQQDDVKPEEEISEDVSLDDFMIPSYDDNDKELSKVTPTEKPESTQDVENIDNLEEEYDTPQFASLMRLDLGDDISQITKEVSFTEQAPPIEQSHSISSELGSIEDKYYNPSSILTPEEVSALMEDSDTTNSPESELVEDEDESQQIKDMIREFQETQTLNFMKNEEPSIKIDVDDIVSEIQIHDNLPSNDSEFISVSAVETVSNVEQDPFLHLVQDNDSLYDEQESMSLDEVMDFVEQTDDTQFDTEDSEPIEDEISLDEVMDFVEETDDTTFDTEDSEPVEDEISLDEVMDFVEQTDDTTFDTEESEPVEDEISLDEVMNFVEETDDTQFDTDDSTEPIEDEISLDEVMNFVEETDDTQFDTDDSTEPIEDEISLDEVMDFVEETDESKQEESFVTEEFSEEDSTKNNEQEVDNTPVIDEDSRKDLIFNNDAQLHQTEPSSSLGLKSLEKEDSDLLPSVVTEGHLVSPMEYPADSKKKTIFFPRVEDLEPNTDDISKFEEDEEIENTMKMIEDTYESFGINMQVVDFNRGPTITRFEIEPPSGLKLRTILNLQDDLALQAGTSNLRIISPVEGRSLIGIEVPNKVRRNFLIREQIESPNFGESKAELPLILGVDVGGEEIVSDLATTPHLLIAGTTGSGKSVYVNALIMGLLFKLSSDDLKFIMIDPKMVELELYNGIPHLLAPIITKPEEAMAALEWAVQEMDRRYKILSEYSVRNIKEYKDLSQGEKLPYIVIIVDEFANLMLRAPKDTEKHISRLASMSRAVGIHLVLATQRPSVDVVTGVIKANFPSRIALRVSSKIDSRTIIDRNGAETLLGKGDMLFMSPNHMEPMRIQSPYASNEDVARTVNEIKKNGAPDYAIDFAELIARQEEGNSENSRTDAVEDPLFEEVLNYAVDSGEVSASGIQRRFRVGYNRASRLIETMKDLKIISPPPSAGKGWLINITRDDISKFL